MQRSNPAVLRRLQGVPVADVFMSVITKSELQYRVEVSPRRAQDTAALAAFLPYTVRGYTHDPNLTLTAPNIPERSEAPAR